ncbi:hypothetical protein D3C80_1642280 [compost metagenome]
MQVGKSPLKNSSRAFQTWVLFLMLVTKMVILTMSFITPPAAVTMSLIFWKTTLACSYSFSPSTVSRSGPRAVMPETKTKPPTVMALDQSLSAGSLTDGE